MKKLLFVILLVTSFSTFAFEVKGKKAEKLYNSLKNAGTIADCAMGTCEVNADNIECQLRGNSVGNPTYTCSLATLTEQDEIGTTSVVSVDGDKAKTLFNSLEATGVQSDGACGSAYISAQSVKCLLTGNSIGKIRFVCTISE